MSMPFKKQATEQEIKERKRKCDTPHCQHKAFLRDWTGYQHCLKDWYRSLRWGSGENNKWFYIKTTKLF